MAKIRTLKAEFFRNAGVSVGGLLTKALAAGLICTVADDDGRFKVKVADIQGEVFTHDSISVEDVDRALQMLADEDFIRVYRDHGRAFGAVVNWKTHQRVPPSRYVASVLPAPPNTKRRRPSPTDRKQSSTDASSRAGVGREGKGREGRGEERKGEDISPTAHPTSGGELLVLEPQISLNPVDQIFAAWKAATGHQRTALDDKRRRICSARLKEGWTVEELIAVVTVGWRNDPWNERPLHNQFEVLLRDSSHVEKFLGYATSGAPVIQPRKNARDLSVEADLHRAAVLRAEGR